MFKTKIGIEIHIQLNTNSKVFCSCKNSINDMQNTHCCAVCMGETGTLPKLNKKVVDKAVQLGLLLDSDINNKSNFDRKHYYYADLVKNFQITQFYKPICSNGQFVYMHNDKEYVADIERIHIEEDACKLIKHDGKIFVDYNRSGVPLLEVVTKPVFEDSLQVRSFLEQFRLLMIYQNISSCNMNEGAYRFDINVSVNDNDEILNNRSELKNMNSFAYAVKAINKEVERQTNILNSGDKPKRQTIMYDNKNDEIIVMRTKESESEYYYMRDYNLNTLIVDDVYANEIRESIDCNDTPIEAIRNIKNKTGYRQKDCMVVASNKSTYDYWCIIVNNIDSKYSKTVYNLVVNNVDTVDKQNKFLVGYMKEIVTLLETDRINNMIATELIQRSIESSKSPIQIAEESNLYLITDKNVIRNIVSGVMKDNEKVVNDIINGKEKAKQTIIGKAVKASDNKVSVSVVNEVLDEIINEVQL